jgi:maltose alpha-D-glucosyltransferase/alpha-amylase
MATEQIPKSQTKAKAAPAAGDALWYKDAIIYQLHVRAFMDSDGDGIGDFAGLTQKLDYLQDLGVSALWLQPFYPSPLRDDGYDIADYGSVHPSYGTVRDFQTFMREAKRRGLRVITELVLNHTSDEHPWFQRARRSPEGSRWRDYYVWSDTPDQYRSARIIFKDFETSNWAWDPVAHAYYWHRFYAHQPDLNMENEEVRRSLFQIVDFWMQMGVDGMRLDAVPYLFEREGTSCENLPETHAFLKQLRSHIDGKYQDRMLLAEANQWPEDAAAYFGDGDECQMNFNFPLMPRLFMSVHMEDRFPIIDILQQTPSIPDNCQWAAFLRNHDELTLEMVTDEDRDYMYRVYAQDMQARINLGIRRRLAPLLHNNRRRIELMNALLFSLPGTPIIYYGDEIGMGDNIYLGDRNSVRTPMQWNGDRNAGFSRANPQRLFLPVTLDPEYHYEAVNVEAHQNNPHSLLWWMKRVMALRKRYRAFGRGSIEFLLPENRKVIAFIRRFEDETILVVANLSRFAQYAELDMSKYKGSVPVELFGRADFPAIGELPYLVTLGPHAFYWFDLRHPSEPEEEAMGAPKPSPLIAVRDWEELLKGGARSIFQPQLAEFMHSRRWFGGKAREMQACHITEVIDVANDEDLEARILLVKVDYLEGESETYQVPVAFASGERAEKAIAEWPDSIITRVNLHGSDTAAVIYEATANRDFSRKLLGAIERRRRMKGGAGVAAAVPADMFRRLRGREPLEASVLRTEQSNTSIGFGDRLVMKIVRRPDPGVNPDLEIGSFLNEHAPEVSTPRVAGYVEYQRKQAQPLTLAIVVEFIKNEGDAWSYTLDHLTSYMEDVLSTYTAEGREAPLQEAGLVALTSHEPPQLATDLMGSYLQSAELLGQRTGELHVALASAPDLPAFSPDPFTPFYQRSVYQGMRGMVVRMSQLLHNRRGHLPESSRDLADSVLAREEELMQRFHALVEERLTGARIRTHADYHLGQVLYTGKDFVIIDFEGEPARPLSERRLKRSPLRDVAGMLRSFHYAAYSALHNQTAVGMVRPEQLHLMETWARYWCTWASAAFMRGYLAEANKAPILPQTPEELEILLEAFLLEKAVYEVMYELNNRPDWVRIPLVGILELLEDHR